MITSPAIILIVDDLAANRETLAELLTDDDFITKPFNRVELRARVRTVTRLNRYRRLNEQRQQFQRIVEHAPDGYVLINAADEILFANARAGWTSRSSSSPAWWARKTPWRPSSRARSATCSRSGSGGSATPSNARWRRSVVNELAKLAGRTPPYELAFFEKKT